jgi:hypothetical protein
MNLKQPSRRAFLKTSLAAAAGLVVLPEIIPVRGFGAAAPVRKTLVS